jgi:opacity protein-like surface antigen
MKSIIAAAALLFSLLTAAVSPARGEAVPATSITVNGNGGARVYDGVGAILGGGGNARYLEDYPRRSGHRSWTICSSPATGRPSSC